MTTQLKDQITAAIGAHSLWRNRLQDAIRAGKSDLDATKVERDDQCELGKWLHSPLDEATKGPQYRKVCEQHALFHKEAARVLRVALTGKKDDATKLLDSDFTKISSGLVGLLMEWKRG